MLYVLLLIWNVPFRLSITKNTSLPIVPCVDAAIRIAYIAVPITSEAIADINSASSNIEARKSMISRPTNTLTNHVTNISQSFTNFTNNHIH